MITKEQFIERAVRAYEKAKSLPPGWWGDWTELTNGTFTIKFTGRAGAWNVYQAAVKEDCTGLTMEKVAVAPSRERALAYVKRLAKKAPR